MNNPIKRYLNHINVRKADNTVKNRIVSLRQFFEWKDDVTIKYKMVDGDKIPIEENKPEIDEYVSIEDYGEYLDELFVRTYHLEDFLDHLLLKEYANRSVQDKVYSVSNFLTYLGTRNVGDIEIDVSETEAENLSGNEIDKHINRRYLEPSEFDKMMRHTEKLRNQIVLQLLWDTGVRASEAVDITESDIDRDNNEIEVENAKSEKMGETTTRKVYYSKKFDLYLTKWYAKGGRDKYMYTFTEEDQGHLLVTKQQPRMGVGRVNQIVQEAAERAGIQSEDDSLYTDAHGRPRKQFTSHSMRHSFAVHRVKNGMPIIYLKQLMGHTDIKHTRQYLKFRNEDIKEAYHKYSP